MEEYVSKVSELNAVIEKLCIVPGECDLEEICGTLDGIYFTPDNKPNSEFRHEYASISGKMRELSGEEKDGIKVFSLDNLVFNITDLYDYALKENKPYIKSLFKLKDHISLEAGRIAAIEELKWEMDSNEESVKSQLEYTKSLADDFHGQVEESKELLERLQNTANECSKQITESEKTLKELEETSQKIQDKMESVQKDSVTILGIFASIVLSFTAGMIFSSSVFENIDKASPYRIVGVVLLIGLVITNLIALLLMYIDRVRQVNPGKITYPKCIKVMNVCYVCGFVADFVTWFLLEKFVLIFLQSPGN